MFEWEDGRILRLYRVGFARSSAEFQARALEAARSAGVRVPTVYGTVEVDGRFGMVMERLDGVDLFTAIGKQPWRVWWVGGITGRTHAGLNNAQAPPDLRSAHERSERMVQTEYVPARMRDAAVARLKELPQGDRLLHGDFHPGNVMIQDGEPVILDWSNATRGDPEADLTRTLMMLRLGDPPPGTSFFLRALAKVGRRVLLGSYRHAYRAVRHPDEALMRAWELPVAVARLSERIEPERPALLKYIEKRL